MIYILENLTTEDTEINTEFTERYVQSQVKSLRPL
jgi:hypothetical protein